MLSIYTHKKPQEFPHLMENSKLATNIAEEWNSLSKQYGWPLRQQTCDVLHKQKVISRVEEGIELLSQLNPPPRPNESIKWILSRWNWEKSPAPLGVLENKDQWKAILSISKRNQEEAQEANKETISKMREWAKKEFKLAKQKGKDAQRARQEIEEFAHATKKTSNMTIDEKLSFCEILEELEKIYDKI